MNIDQKTLNQLVPIVVEQTGRIKILDTSNWSAVGTYLDISSQISSGGERGLLGLAFDPDYASNGYFYVNYTDSSGDTVVSRFSVSGNPNDTTPVSSTTTVAPPSVVTVRISSGSRSTRMASANSAPVLMSLLS